MGHEGRQQRIAQQKRAVATSQHSSCHILNLKILMRRRRSGDLSTCEVSGLTANSLAGFLRPSGEDVGSLYTVSWKPEGPSLVKFTYYSYYLSGQPCTRQSLQSSLTSSQRCCPPQSRHAMSDTKPTSRPSWAGSYQYRIRVATNRRPNPVTDIRTSLDQRLRVQLPTQQSTSYRATRSFLESSRS